jgi:hypothetical protein
MNNSDSDQFMKDPAAIEWFGVDWTARLAGENGLVAPDTVAASTWLVPVGLTSIATHMTGSMTGIKLSGGITGTNYAVTNEIVTTVNSETLRATIHVYIKTE